MIILLFNSNKFFIPLPIAIGTAFFLPQSTPDSYQDRIILFPFRIQIPPFTIHHSPLTTHHSPLITHHSPLTTHQNLTLLNNLTMLCFC